MLERLQDLLNEAEVNFLMGRIDEEQYQMVVMAIMKATELYED